MVTPSKDREGRSHRHGSRRRHTRSLLPGEHLGSESERESRRSKKHKKKSKKRRHYSVRVGSRSHHYPAILFVLAFHILNGHTLHVSLSHVHVPFFTVAVKASISIYKSTIS